MSISHWPDLLIMIAYLIVMMSVGVWFSREQSNTETYFIAKRSIPPWAMGFSIVATLVTSLTFIAYPGSSYGKDWSLLIPAFFAIIVLASIGGIIVPFYRHAVGMSAYEYFGKRFGGVVRKYSSIAFSLAHFSKMGFVFYLLALTVTSMTGWNTDLLILGVGVVTIFYTMIGGFEAVIWTDVIQGFVLWVGVFVALGYLLFLPPGGLPAVFSMAWEAKKFSLGSAAPTLSQQTIWVLILYGFFWYVQKYTADQTLIQRYLVAKTDQAAIKGAMLGACLCVPVWTLFMLIGSCTWAFYKLTGEKLPAFITKADQVFPYFLTTHLPSGMAGLFMASLMGAAMSGLASDLNALAVVGVEDFYRAFRPKSTDKSRLLVGKLIVAAAGSLCIAIAIVLAHARGSALALWFSASAILSGGLAGIFILAFLSSRTNRRGIYIGISATILFTSWATLTQSGKLDLGGFNYKWHDLTIGAVAHLVMIVFGYAGSLLFPREQTALTEITLWKWLRIRNQINQPEPSATTV